MLVLGEARGAGMNRRIRCEDASVSVWHGATAEKGAWEISKRVSSAETEKHDQGEGAGRMHGRANGQTGKGKGTKGRGGS